MRTAQYFLFSQSVVAVAISIAFFLFFFHFIRALDCWVDRMPFVVILSVVFFLFLSLSCSRSLHKFSYGFIVLANVCWTRTMFQTHMDKFAIKFLFSTNSNGNEIRWKKTKNIRYGPQTQNLLHYNLHTRNAILFFFHTKQPIWFFSSLWQINSKDYGT